MKTKLITFCCLLSALLGRAQTNTNAVLSAVVYPGYVFNTTEPLSASKLNRLGRPTILISGTLSGSASIGTNIIMGYHLNSGIPGLGDTNGLKFDTDHNLQVDVGDLNGAGLRPYPNYETNSHQLAVNVDSNYIVFDATGTNISFNWTNYTLLSVVTNDDVFTFYSVATNASNLYGTNPAMRTVTFNSISNAVVANLASNVAVRFTSSLVTGLVSGVLISNAHGLGVTPKRMWPKLVCVSPDCGYAVGDELPIASSAVYSTLLITSPALIAGANGTNVWLVCRSQLLNYLLHRTTGDQTAMDASSWAVQIVAEP